MNKYLIEILKIQSSVILPGLGALMIPNQKSGTVVFNQHLKFNDGSFARFIAEKEGIDQQESQNKVAKFVREIEADLGKGLGYDMFEFGKFYKNEAGEVAFVMHGKDKPETHKEEEKPSEKATIAAPIAILEANKKEEEDKAKAKAEKLAEKQKLEAEQKATEEKAAENLKIEAEKKAAEEKANQEKLAAQLKLEAEQKAANELKAKEEEAAKKAAELERLEEEKVQKAPVLAAIIETKVEEIVEVILPEETVSEPVMPLVEPTVEPVIIAESKPEVVEAPPISPTENRVESDKIILDKQSKNTYTPAANVSETTTNKPNLVSETAANLAAETSAQANNSRNKPGAKEKKKRSKLPWLILLLLLIGLGVTGFFFKDQLMAYFDKGEDKTVVDSTLAQTQNEASDHTTDEMDSTAVTDATLDETMAEEVIEEPVEEVVDEKPVTVVQNDNGGSYHLIGNSFGEEANAANYAQKMKDKGYPAKVLGRYDGLYLVSIKSFNSKEAAESGKSGVSQDASGAWVFKQK